jgi:hypothetical protein
MSKNWKWLIGRKFSLGEVIDVYDTTATVLHGYNETRILICELLEEDYKTQEYKNINDVPYPLRLCVKMMHYAAFCERTENMRAGEINDALRPFFDDAIISQSVDIITGRTPDQN